MEKDWKLSRGQICYLKDASLQKKFYQPKNPNNDHDHCEFCMEKFSEVNGHLNIGYCTLDHDIWICFNCYEDFKELFNWKIKE